MAAAEAEPLNEVRFEVYHTLARAFFFQTHHPVRTATMMLDVRFPEVPRAFASALVAAAGRHPNQVPSVPLGSAVGVAFEEVLVRTTQQAFGTSERDAVPSWFLQNYEYFFSELLRELLALFDRYATLMDGKPASPPQLRRVFAMAFEMCGGARRWLSLDCLAAKFGKHLHTYGAMLFKKSRLRLDCGHFANRLIEAGFSKISQSSCAWDAAGHAATKQCRNHCHMWIDPHAQRIADDLDGVAADLVGPVGTGGVGVHVGDQEEAVVGGLHLHPPLDRSDPVAEMEIAGRGVAGENTMSGGLRCHAWQCTGWLTRAMRAGDSPRCSPRA